MSGGGASAVRNTLYAIISRECRHFQDGIVFDATNPSRIPPYGTCDFDGSPTAVDISSNSSGGVNFPKSAAFAACHQFIGGKTSITTSFGGETFDVVDLNDTVIPRQHYKGPRNFSGNIELWDGDIDLILWSSMIQGKWNPLTRKYGDATQLRHFEIWVLVNPRDANDQEALNLTAIKADKLIRLFNVTFPTHDVEWTNPNKITVPYNFSLVENWAFWEQPTEATLRAIADISTGGIFNANTEFLDDDVTASNEVWTRLNIEIAGATVADNSIITVIGTDPMGNRLNEPIDVGTTPGVAFTRQTKGTFQGPVTIEFSAGFTVAGTADIKDVDFGLTPTLDAAGGVPTTS